MSKLLFSYCTPNDYFLGFGFFPGVVFLVDFFADPAAFGFDAAALVGFLSEFLAAAAGFSAFFPAAALDLAAGAALFLAATFLTLALEGGEPREFLLALAFSLDLVEADFLTTAAPSFDLGFLVASVLGLTFLVAFFTSAFSPNLYLLLFFPSSRAFLKIPFSTPFFRAKERYIVALFSSPTSWTSLICFSIAVLEHPVLSLSSLIASIIISEYFGCEGPSFAVAEEALEPTDLAVLAFLTTLPGGSFSKVLSFA